MIALTVAQSHTTPVEWLFVVGAFAILGAGALGLLTGLPAYAAAALLIATWALAVALVGFMWDVSWHIDLGRDAQLFTPAHTMILVGIGGIAAAGAAGIVYATLEGLPTAWRAGRLHIPP